MTAPVRGRPRRRWRWVALTVLLIGAGLIVSLPWLLKMPAAQRRLAAEANKILAPSSVEFSEVRLSWFRSTEIASVVLHDARGDRLVAAPRATFSWSLWQILVSHPKTAILAIKECDVDIERSADGTVDLYETLKPVISEHPPVRLVIRVDDGRLRFRDPAFTDPVVANKANIVLDLGRNSDPIHWNLQLAQPQVNGQPSRMEIEGNYSRSDVGPSGQHDLVLALKGTRWPWTLANSLVQARGELTGNLDAKVQAGRVRVDCDATITNLIAIGDALSSDTVHLETARAQLKLEGNAGTWTVDKLDVTSAVVSLQGQGSIPPEAGKGAWLESSVDLAAVARELPATLHLRDDLRVERGSARIRADIVLGPDGQTEDWNVAGKIAELAARLGEKSLTLSEPATVVAKLQHAGTATKLDRLDIHSSFLKATGQGDLDRGIAVTATVDLAALGERFRDWIDLGQVELAGQGKLEATYRRQGEDYLAGVNAAFRDLRVGGLPLVGKVQRELLTINGNVAGGATPSGWPRSWRELSLQSSSGEADLKLSAQATPAPGEFVVSGRASTPLNLDDRPHRLEGELLAKSAQGTWTAERLTLALVRASKRGSGAAPDEAIRWEGKGRYDSRRDELAIASLASPPRPPNQNETWITGDQTVRASGLKSVGAAQIEVAANADLSSLGRWLSPRGPTWGGRIDALARARRDRELWNLGLRVEIRDGERAAGDGSKFGLAGSAVMTANAGYTPKSDRLDVTELTLKAPYVQVEGSGVVRGLTSRADVDLNGSLNPDWREIQALLAQKVEPNARIAGRPRAWRLAGIFDSLPAIDRMGSLEGEIGVQVDSLDVFGMRLSAVPVVLRAAHGRLTVNPIDAKLNSGVLHLEPELVRGKDDSTWLHLGRESSLEGAVVNDEVSHRVLSFAAPILDGATRVEGRVSLALADAYFPVIAPSEAQARIEGDLLFDDVRFMPGPLADELLSVFRLDRRPLAVLRDPVAVRIAGRKVYQDGLVIPVGNIASIGVNGSVDFDQNLDLVARFALTPPRSSVPVLSPILEHAKFDLPIRGTLKNPKIDGEALKAHWAEIGTDLLGNSMLAGVDGLQRMLQGLPGRGLRGLIPPARRPAPPPPRAADPDEGQAPRELEVPRTDPEVRKSSDKAPERPAPLTAAERKKVREQRRQERLQKKAERRAKQAPE
jgi:translocation and assembly module TamB